MSDTLSICTVKVSGVKRTLTENSLEDMWDERPRFVRMCFRQDYRRARKYYSMLRHDAKCYAIGRMMAFDSLTWVEER